MRTSLGRDILTATLATAMLTACAGSGGVPGGASSAASAPDGFGKKHGLALSGEYVGKIHDSIYGTSRTRLYLSQSQNMLGGAFVNEGASHSRSHPHSLAAAVVWVVNGSFLSGNGVSTSSPFSGVCAFSMSARHTDRSLNGSYTATIGCSGENGFFEVWHKCYIKGLESDAVRPESRVKPCDE